MAITLYEKDECAPDAKSAREWLSENLGIHDFDSKITLDYGDTMIHFFEHDREVFYGVEYSCGKFETVRRYDAGELRDLVFKFTMKFVRLSCC